MMVKIKTANNSTAISKNSPQLSPDSLKVRISCCLCPDYAAHRRKGVLDSKPCVRSIRGSLGAFLHQGNLSDLHPALD